ncbi:MAG: hypothetical protein AAGA99_23385 [Actinomycetota bacterium]
MSDVTPHEDEMHIVRVISDPTSRDSRQHVVPNTHELAASAQDSVEVVPVLPGSAYDRGPVV